MPESSDPCTYPGTDVLRNLAGIRDPLRLAAFEANATASRLAKLDATPLKGSFGAAHLREIHKYIFQDVYTWAGEFRTTNLSRGGHLFAVPVFIGQALETLLQQLAVENNLQGISAERFAVRAGFYLGELNAVHPFREGNGRAQREYIRELGIAAGFVIAWSAITRGQMTAASRESFSTGNSSGLAALVRACLG